ncbi:glutathione transferase GstA [Janthinobacterium sp. BJB1]|uniref:glutathione transferase GstA n=1 Tax=Janthinobacterium sp. GW458P TaxID=1981504 RepID=UPI000A329FCA|nr:glutathione transferase GstA [Janthinobacterium sp. GW458P]MBE3024406.1 glutathione transferase GstA [Janthinobacterium sp. GW458P]PHV15180.1 glutathione transferase GstA [Janthinobacterium sp. BJB303]PJC98141.1 glutathione transferase GstA [Janthinobacterium sp. BJB1]
MKLFYSPGACSLAPHIIARETGAAFTLVKVDLGQHRTQEGSDYYALNPKGQVPLLVLDDGATLSEGPVIAQYLAELAGRHDLLPPVGKLARYEVLEWQNYITSELHKSFSPLFDPRYDAAAKALFIEQLGKKYKYVDSRLEGRAYLTGEQFTVADAYLFAVTGWAPNVGVDLSQLAHVQAFLGRMAQRDSVKAAWAAEGLAKAA